MYDAAELARLRIAFEGEYEITEHGAALWAVRCDGTTPMVRAETVTGLREAIRENRRNRPRMAVS